MKLGFYYHTSISCLDGELCLPEVFGIFLEELVRQFELLVLVLHEGARRRVMNSMRFIGLQMSMSSLAILKDFQGRSGRQWQILCWGSQPALVLFQITYRIMENAELYASVSHAWMKSVEDRFGTRKILAHWDLVYRRMGFPFGS